MGRLRLRAVALLLLLARVGADADRPDRHREAAHWQHAPETAAAFWPAFAARVGASWPAPPPHTPRFVVDATNLTLLGSAGPYIVRVFCVRDAASPSKGIVAAYVPSASENVERWKPGSNPELNLLVPLPELAPAELPPMPRYGWAWLWGAKMVTIPWLDCCNITGDSAGFNFTADGQEEITLTQWQVWTPTGSHRGRDAQSTHTFTLRYDSAVGYMVDVVAGLRINAAAAPKQVELLNFLTPQLANPWPLRATHPVLGGPRSIATAWSVDAGASFTGFAENLLAGAMLHAYNLSQVVGSSGAVVMAAPGGFSAALAFAGPVVHAQATCPTWMDQHQMVFLPEAAPDGFVTVAPTFSLAYLPAAASDFLLAHTRLITHVGDGSRGNGSAIMLRLGETEDFSHQPVPLTEPLRALVQSSSGPDFKLVDAGGGRGRALAIASLTPSAATALYAFANALPLVPLNVSTAYVAQASALAPACAGAVAKLTVFLYEDDDFNNAPSRLLSYNSSNAEGGTWASLRVAFTSPKWASYADLRLEALSMDDGHQCNASALFDDFFFGVEE